ncbi:MAG TPA: hypothetical protein VLK82_20380 [Candidatus Tectomicrobia bacterium]|nr:hypothetical protein [Candidatus Tectomicrobia bacterium]
MLGDIYLYVKPFFAVATARCPPFSPRRQVKDEKRRGHAVCPLSASNWLYDRREKMRTYQGAGVPEYRIASPLINSSFGLRQSRLC